MRPRKKDHHLPRSVYFKHGAYYRVVNGHWYRLGTDPKCLETPFATTSVNLPEYKTALLEHMIKRFPACKQNAKSRGISFEIEREQLVELFGSCGWRCAVSRTVFSMEKVNKKRPFAPSLDRIDSSKGYSIDNCRLVCVAVNMAMNDWGEDVLWRLFNRKTDKGLNLITK